jgi:hypothetical protein
VLFCTFFLINIFFIWIVINILNVEEKLKTQQSLISNDAKVMFFQGNEDVRKDQLIDLLKNKKVILEGNVMTNSNGEKTEIKGIYYNYDIDKKYPLREGRMFTIEEIMQKKKVALVGYNLKDEIKNNTIKIQNEDYEVVGILGEKNSNALKDSIFINLNAQDFSLNRKAITIDVANEKASDLVMDISKTLNESKKVDINISEPFGKADPLKQALGDNKMNLIMALLVSICLISTVINISSYWIDKEKPIIGIKSLVGGTKKMMTVKFWIEYESVIALSLISSYIVWLACNTGNGVNGTLVLKSLGLLTLINIIVSTVAIIPPVINLNKLNINSIIKENI